jgi:hypothetical protein
VKNIGELTEKECRGVLKYFVLKEKSDRTIYDDMSVLPDDKCPSHWFFMTPSIATKFQYINSLLFSFSLTTCFGPYWPSSGEMYN